MTDTSTTAAADIVAKKRAKIEASRQKLQKAIDEYRALANFESLPIVKFDEAPASSSAGPTTTPILSPSESFSTLTAATATTTSTDKTVEVTPEWKVSALSILGTLDQYKLLLKPAREGQVLPLNTGGFPSSLDSLREQLDSGVIGSLESFKIAAGFIMFAASLHLTLDETGERERLVSLFGHLL